MQSRNAILWSAVLACLLAGCVTAEQIRQADARRELGLTYLNEGNTEGALKELLGAKKVNPRDARIRHELGLAFFAKELYPEAEKELLAAIELDPTLTEAKLNLGSLYLSQERYSEAAVYFKQVTEDYLYRSPARAYNNLGWAYYKMGRDDEALSAYDHALRLSPSFCQVLYNASLIYEKRNALELTASHLDRAVSSCPDDLRYRLQLGVIQARLDRHDEALMNLEQVAASDPTGELGAQAREYLRTLR